MKQEFQHIFLFGFSHLFQELSTFAIDIDLRCTVVYAPRQQDSIDSLSLSSRVERVCVSSLECPEYIALFEKSSENSQLGISFGSPFIFKSRHIDDFSGNLINSHGAPLPQFKGGGGFSWRILQRDRRGASLMHIVTEGIDEGPIVFRRDFLFEKSARRPLHYEEIQLKHDREFLLPWLYQLIASNIQLNPIGRFQDRSVCHASYYPRLLTDFHGFIDWSMGARDIESFILAFSSPYSGASTYINGAAIRIFDCKVINELQAHPFVRGMIIDTFGSSLVVACSNGTILIDREDIQFESGSSPLRLGDRFFTPDVKLALALRGRVSFSPDGPSIHVFDIDEERL